MTDDPDFRTETHSTVEPTDGELIAYLRQKVSDEFTRAEKAEAALQQIVAQRESWYEAMGDDQAGLPVEADEAWKSALEYFGASS